MITPIDESLTDIVGSLHERGLLDRVFKNPDALNDDVAVAMQPPLATVDARASLDDVFADLSGPSAAVVVGLAGRPAAILTRSDLLEYLAFRRTQVESPALDLVARGVRPFRQRPRPAPTCDATTVVASRGARSRRRLRSRSLRPPASARSAARRATVRQV